MPDHLRLRSCRPAALHRRGLRRPAGGWRARHGVRRHLDDPACSGSACRPARASARVHAVEVFTTGVPDQSHLPPQCGLEAARPPRHTGVIGGALGAHVLTQIHAETARPFVLAYLAAIGLYLIWRGFHFPPEHKPAQGGGAVRSGRRLPRRGRRRRLGADRDRQSARQGADPRRTIGTVNTAEFLVTVTISATFIAALGWEAFTTATVGLLIGGVAAAPIGAFAVKKARGTFLLKAVGILLTCTSLYGVYTALTH